LRRDETNTQQRRKEGKMRKRIAKTLLIPFLITCILFPSIIQMAYAHYNTYYLSYTRYVGYHDSKKYTSSFSYSGKTYQYELASAVDYYQFVFNMDPRSHQGAIRFSGGAKIINPSGYPKLEVLSVTLKFILYPLGKAAWWHWWYSHTHQDAELVIWDGGLATINLQIQRPGDETLRQTFDLVFSEILSYLEVPFNPFSISYLFLKYSSDLDKNAGPAENNVNGYSAHVTGRAGSYPSTYASVAVDTTYRYLREDDSGVWKKHELGIEVTAQFGYDKQYRDGTMRVYAATKTFRDYWTVYVWWPN